MHSTLPASQEDLYYMRRALDLAWQGQYTAHPNPRVGCVLVRDNQIVGEGWHKKTGDLHAECYALEQAKEKANHATCYISLEPCAHQGKTAPCVSALIDAKIKKVIIATIDPNPLVSGKGIQALEQAGIEVKLGLLQAEAKNLNQGFFSRMIRHQPYVRAKIAMSLDGRVAMASGESQWITNNTARQDVHRWRARSGAVLTGSGTVKQDNCRLTVRDSSENNIAEQPLRVVIDSKLQLSQDAAIFHQPGKTVIACAETAPLPSHKLNYIAFPQKNNYIDLSALLLWLGKQEINDLLVEAGPTLTGVLLQQGLVDELLVYIAPKLLGDNAKPMAHLPGLLNLKDHIQGSFDKIEKIDSDLYINLKLSEFARQ